MQPENKEKEKIDDLEWIGKISSAGEYFYIRVPFHYGKYKGSVVRIKIKFLEKKETEKFQLFIK